MKKFTTVKDVTEALGSNNELYTHFADHFKVDTSTEEGEKEFNDFYGKLKAKDTLEIANNYVELANVVKDDTARHGGNDDSETIEYNVVVKELDAYDNIYIHEDSGSTRSAVLRLQTPVRAYKRNKDTGENEPTKVTEIHLSYGQIKQIAKRAGIVRNEHHTIEVEGKSYEHDVTVIAELNSILRNRHIVIDSTFHEAGEEFITRNGVGTYERDCFTNVYRPQNDKFTEERKAYANALAVLNSRPM